MPKIVMTGTIAARRACFKMTRRDDSPLAVAVRT